VKQYRNYSVENNAPYFRVMMKRFFYYYKPTLRWERTMRVATMRKARRKGSRVFRKNSSINYFLFLFLQSKNKNDNFVFASENKIDNSNNQEKLNPFNLQKPTHSYSLVRKRASRYRYQIYKDVLQHWYYNKMNRLLLKLDVDSFIKRQPKNHFLTKNEETLLHIKRFLLFEYYNSLRWYNSMEHYNMMKTTIGKTKSFSNRSYNQQFFGTFQKIRHLFSITPSLNYKVLKFDQLLYNEFPSNSIVDSVIHEELKIPNSSILIETMNTVPGPPPTPPRTGEGRAGRAGGCSFCFSKGKTKTIEIFSILPKKDLGKSTNVSFKNSKFIEDFWFPLFHLSQNKLYDQKGIKNIVLSRVEKKEKLYNSLEKIMKIRLEKWKNFRPHPPLRGGMGTNELSNIFFQFLFSKFENKNENFFYLI